MKKSILLFSLIFLAVIYIHGESPFTLITQPTLILPMGPETDEGTSFYSMGGGATMEGELNLNSLKVLHFGPTLEYDILPIMEGDTALNLFNFGANVGLKLNPLSRTIWRIWGGGGGSLAMYEGLSSLFPYYTAGSDLTFRLSPSVNLGVGGRYVQGQASGTTVYQTAGVSLNLGYNFQPASRGAEIRYNADTLEIFPLYYTWYDENPLGEVTLSHSSTENIKNVRASFYVPQYMEQPKSSDVTIGNMKRGEEATIPLQGLFTNDIFSVNEGLKVAAEVKVAYEYFGKTYEETLPLTVQINNKNAMTWDDDRKAASFVTANNPLVYSYARSLSAKIRGASIDSLDKNFQIGMGLFEALTLYGIGYAVDPSSAYADLSENTEVIDYIQFPQQTLISQAGDCDDLSVLYASMLEASGIPAAFITIPGHIYVAYQLDMDESKARRRFPGAENLLYRDDKAWLPVEVTLVEDGFLLSWETGARQIRDNDGEYGFFPVREAWQTYPAAEFESSGIAYLPSPEDVLIQHNKSLNRFLRQEVNMLVASLNQQILDKGKSHILYNKMGVTYARYGFMDDAKEWFEKVIGEKEFYPSLINLGNIYYLQKNAPEASRYYARALDVKPDSEKALVGMIRVSSELEDYDRANTSLAALNRVNPGAASDIRHLGTAGTARASSAQNREVDEWSEE